ncbi:hypothetical protein O181_115303 [Austropuccinia psidii MF-1]|uniref:Uncharacterized protein n=1 Tax=Austropuccinia psidii MF-1 TaxID=1389203 RepID=A0A9Q3K678_9BASI|nr:hypothetical protein [Austropuccinia psidii MF-1]
MSSKLTELTESSPSAPPPSVLHGSGILSRFSSPSMASFGHFDPTKTYDGYKEVEVLHPACTELTGSRKRDVARWTNVGGPIQVGGRPIYSSSEGPISRINTEGIVKRIRQMADSPPDPDAEGVEVVLNSAGPPYNTSPSQTPAMRSQSQVIPSTPRTCQPTLATITTSIPPASPGLP